eukprot:3145131-Pyramimonas_sp.AAC.1
MALFVPLDAEGPEGPQEEELREPQTVPVAVGGGADRAPMGDDCPPLGPRRRRWAWCRLAVAGA